ncbi:MAG: YfhO family protein [Acidobacteriia bacterium]|nr:YfhO family protein [Terriglobia bacterium]
MNKKPLPPRLAPPLLVILGVVSVFWKLALTKQYTFLASPDLSNQVMPWLQAQVFAIRHWYVLLWDPYEWFGQSLIGQVQPGVASPFTFLLALAPVRDGLIQLPWVHLWFVLIHCAAGLFAYWFFIDLECSAAAAVIGAIFYATAGFCGNTEWPQHLASGIWAPLVFLFLLRTLRGRAPLKSAAWAGVALGLSWLSGHHAPPLALTLAAAGVGLVELVRSRFRRDLAVRLTIVFGVMVLVSGVQSLPAREYGRWAKRWTATGALTWKDKVQYPEHEDSGLRPTDLLHVVIPGGGGLRSDPFMGAVALSLAIFAVWSAFGRREVRFFLLLGICALLYAMARFDALYGWLYALFPLVEKSRAPIVALSVFHCAAAALVALGADRLFAGNDPPRRRAIIKGLIWFGAITLGLFLLMSYLKPAISSGVLDGDSRPGMTALLAVMLAGVYHAWGRGYVARRGALAMRGLLLIIEQGNEVGSGWAHVRDANRMAPVKLLYDTLDIADYLRHQPDPKRVEINDKDIVFTFGDWYHIDTSAGMTASMLTATSELGSWWRNRVQRMYGVNYTVSRTPTREGLQEVFWGKSGIKVYKNPAAFPRAWTVHRTILAPNEWNGATMVNDWTFDLRTTALLVRNGPPLDQCGGEDKVTAVEERPSSVRVKVEMACRGLLVVSDNWYPGWTAQVDGRYQGIWKVNTVIRGVVVPAGRHEVVMRYRPLSVYFGLALTILGLLAAVVLQRRPEKLEPE